MAKTGYKPGDPWFIDDISGFKYRFSDSVKDGQNPGLRVHRDHYNPRHPQERVRSIKEMISVKDARPRPTDIHQLDPSETTLSITAAKGATSITVASATGISDGYYISVITDDGTQLWTTVNGSPTGAVVTLTTGMVAQASSGNTVYFTASLGTVSGSDL